MAAPACFAYHATGMPMSMGWGGQDSSAIDLLLAVGKRMEPAVKGKDAKPHPNASKKSQPNSDKKITSSTAKGTAGRGGPSSRGGGKKSVARGGHLQQNQSQQSSVYTTELLELLEEGLKADKGFSSGSSSYFAQQPAMQAQGGLGGGGGGGLDGGKTAASQVEGDFPMGLEEVTTKKSKPKKAKTLSKNDKIAGNASEELDMSARVEGSGAVDEGKYEKV